MASVNDWKQLSLSRFTVDDLTASRAEPFVFGSMALLVDNALLCAATEISIFSAAIGVRSSGGLCFQDNGSGFSATSCASLLLKEVPCPDQSKRATHRRYSNTFCMSTMRMGSEAIIFSRNRDEVSCGLISQRLQDEVGCIDNCKNETLAPFLAWQINSSGYATTLLNRTRYSANLAAFASVSPFKTTESLLEVISRIGEHGTIIIVYNLWEVSETPNSGFELKSIDGNDIGVSPMRNNKSSPFNSFRNYISRIYSIPRISVILEGENVLPYHPFRNLAFLRRFVIEVESISNASLQKQFLLHRKQTYQAEAKKISARIEVLIESMRQLISQGRPIDAALSISLRDAREQLAKYKDITIQIQNDIVAAEEKISIPTQLTFVYGINVDRRWDSGALIYSNGRAIRMYDRFGLQLLNDPMSPGAAGGLVAFVDLPAECLQPRSHFQGFIDIAAYRVLCKTLDDCAKQYWNAFKKQHRISSPRDVNLFWEQLGYSRSLWCSSPDTSNAPSKSCKWLHCVNCLSWKKCDPSTNPRSFACPAILCEKTTTPLSNLAERDSWVDIPQFVNSEIECKDGKIADADSHEELYNELKNKSASASDRIVATMRLCLPKIKAKGKIESKAFDNRELTKEFSNGTSKFKIHVQQSTKTTHGAFEACKIRLRRLKNCLDLRCNDVRKLFYLLNNGTAIQHLDETPDAFLEVLEIVEEKFRVLPDGWMVK